MTKLRLPAVERWENEGGATNRSPGAAAARRALLPRLNHSTKASQDTAAGCRARAAADLAAAATMDTANGRLKFEHSAFTWSTRGELLARLETGRRRRGRGATVPID